MSNPNVSDRRSRTATAACLVAFPLLLVAETPFDRVGGTGPSAYLAATGHPERMLAAAILIIASAVANIHAGYGLARWSRGRAPMLSPIAAGAATLGAIGHAGIGFIYLMLLSLPGGDRSEMVGYADRALNDTRLGLVLMPLLLAFNAGLILLSTAGWRAGLVSRWVPLTAAAIVLAYFTVSGQAPWIEAALLVVLCIPFTLIAIGVVKDDQRDTIRRPEETTASVTVTRTRQSATHPAAG